MRAFQRAQPTLCWCLVGVTDGVSEGEPATEAASIADAAASGSAMKDALASAPPFSTSTFASACRGTNTSAYEICCSV